MALAAANGLYRFQEALRGVIDNFPVAPARWLMRAVVFPLGAHYRPAPDCLAATGRSSSCSMRPRCATA